MDQNAATKDSRQQVADSPLAWFVVLDNARETNDFRRAAAAQRELERLGVVVRYVGNQKKGARQ